MTKLLTLTITTHTQRLLMLTALWALLLMPLQAQDNGGGSEMMYATGSIEYVNEKGEPQNNDADVIVLAMAAAEAAEAEQAYRHCFGTMKDPQLTERLMELSDKYAINQNNYTRSLYFRVGVLPGMVLLFISEEEGLVVRVPIVKGKTNYDGEVKFKMNAIEGVTKVGHLSEQPMADVESEDTDDGWVTLNWAIQLPKGYARDDARMIVQPYIIECASEDTMAYKGAKVIEGEVFHKQQNKRMGFNFMKNDKLVRNPDDSLAIYDGSAILKEGFPIRISGTVKYKKPDSLRTRTFDAPLYYSLEDYTHVYLDSVKECDCLSYRPFKFLDFTAALSDLKLSQEFYEKPSNQIQNRNRNLNLKFEVGKSVLTTDSVNDQILDQLRNELTSAGKTLVGLTVTGSASPDGVKARNEALARERASVARDKISRFVSVRPSIGAPKVYTWSDVADRLREEAKDSLAAQVSAIVAQGGATEVQGRAIAQLPFYNTDIEPILVGMRVMTCSYQFTQTYIMTPAECLQHYYENRAKYIANKQFTDLSNGDIFHLYQMVKDSLELDTITWLAYNFIKSEPDFAKYNAVSPYVCNRMSVMMMKRGKPNSAYLKPFIDFRRRGNVRNPASPTSIEYTVPVRGRKPVMFNRRQIMINQTVCYYMDTKADTALFLVRWLKDAGKGDMNIDRLEKFINLKQLHPKRKKLRGQDLQDYQSAKALALSTSDENKAILYTEIEDWGMRDNAMMWVNKMHDDDARKWYLKGILWAQKTTGEPPIRLVSAPKKKDDGQFYRWSDEKKADMFGTPELEEYNKRYLEWKAEHPDEEPPLESGEAPKADDKADASVDLEKFKGIPRYLAYFNHSFMLDRTMFDYYIGEKNVSADNRKKFKWRRKNKDLYEEMFNIIKNENDNNALVDESKKKAAAEGTTPTEGEPAAGTATPAEGTTPTEGEPAAGTATTPTEGEATPTENEKKE